VVEYEKSVVDSCRAVRSTILTEEILPCTIMSATITVEIQSRFVDDTFRSFGAEASWKITRGFYEKRNTSKLHWCHSKLCLWK